MSNIDTELLRKRIRQNGLTQSELANRVGVSRTTILNTLSGKNTPSLFVVSRISIILELSVEDIMRIFFGGYGCQTTERDLFVHNIV